MNLEYITTKIYNDPWFYNQLLKVLNYNGRKSGYISTEYAEDFYQDMFLILYKNEKDTIDSWNNGKIKQYYNKILYNNIESGSSPFFKTYRKKNLMNVELNPNLEIEELPDDIYKNSFDIKKYCEDNKLFDWYESEIFKLYFRINNSFIIDDISEKVSYNKIAKELGITYHKVQRRLSIIKFKIYSTIINDNNLNKDIKEGDEELGMIYMVEYIDKFKKKYKNYDKFYKGI